jgi:hypothetical protein
MHGTVERNVSYDEESCRQSLTLVKLSQTTVADAPDPNHRCTRPADLGTRMPS